VTKKIVHSGI